MKKELTLQKTILLDNDFCTIFQVIDYTFKIWFRLDKITGKKQKVNSYFDENGILIFNK